MAYPAFQVLIDADLLMFTQPLEFLTELVRLPMTQRSGALLPVVHKVKKSQKKGLASRPYVVLMS